MTTDFVMAYVPKKMRELGVKRYAITFRELVIPSKGTVNIDAMNQFYFLVGGFDNTYSITSETGVYDQNATNINELLHEHTGKITIDSAGGAVARLQFIVVIPNSNKK